MKKFNFLSVVKTVFTFTLLMAVATACSNSVSSEEEHEDAEGFRIDMDNQTIVEQLPEQDLTGEIELTLNESLSFTITFLDHDGDEFQPEDDEFSLGYEFETEGIVEFTLDENNKWSFQLHGETADTTGMTIFLKHGDHPDFTSQNIPVYVNQTE